MDAEPKTAELAALIYSEMERLAPTAVVQGDPRAGSPTLLDGYFDLRALAARILAHLKEAA